jgi:hypothetical protein
MLSSEGESKLDGSPSIRMEWAIVNGKALSGDPHQLLRHCSISTQKTIISQDVQEVCRNFRIWGNSADDNATTAGQVPVSAIVGLESNSESRRDWTIIHRNLSSSLYVGKLEASESTPLAVRGR